MILSDFFKKFNNNISWISNNTIYLVRHGSCAYGTNTPESDEDFKGVCIPPRKYFFGTINNFEQAELKDPDTVIFDIRKFFKLAIDCNPNIIEVLFVEPQDIMYIDDLGETLLEHRDKFLSKKVKYTMTGYAISQLNRIKLHKRWIMHPPKEPPTRASLGLPEQTLIPQDQLAAAYAEVQKELDRFQLNFLDNLDESTKISCQNTMISMLAELKITADQHWAANARKIGLNDNLIEIMQKERAYTSKKKEWDQYQNWKKTRNPKRAILEEKYGYDCKHAYHLVRLIRMCREILLTGKVIVKRPDREELLAIRNGAWTYDQLIDFANTQEKNLNELYLTSNILPKSPDKETLDKLCIELIEKSISNYSWYNIKKLFK